MCHVGVVLQCERKLAKLVKSMDTLKVKLDGHHKEHGRLKTEEQVRLAWFRTRVDRQHSKDR